MNDATKNLGICFFADRLYYAINDNSKSSNYLERIGSFGFNFNVFEAVSNSDTKSFEHVKNTVSDLIDQYKIQSLRALTYPGNECWTVMPKVAYDNADEREAHLGILMKGVPREDLEPTWHTLSKDDFRFLCIRRRSIMNGLNEITKKVAITDFVSDFELAQKWSKFSKPGGSFLMLGCHKNIITATSFLLGKFRAATFIHFDSVSDLPYHWLQHAMHSKWLKGLYENIYLFGHHTHETRQALESYWYSSAKVTHLNSLENIGVNADEETYGFDLAAAFPSILLSIDL